VANPESGGSDTCIELTLPAELFAQLGRIAEASGLRDAVEAAIVGLAEWAAARQTELDNRDPARKYFINEALDELCDRRK
jgi:hypothetical protein